MRREFGEGLSVTNLYTILLHAPAMNDNMRYKVLRLTAARREALRNTRRGLIDHDFMTDRSGSEKANMAMPATTRKNGNWHRE